MNLSLGSIIFWLSCMTGILAKGNVEIEETNNLRDKKLFSLFSVVTFKNDGCASTDSGRNGTCYTSTECSDKGGTAKGNCAAGFGVCCVFTISSGGSTTSENCSYIQNPSYPSVYSATTSLTYTVDKCSTEVCAIRLDFETFTTAGPSSTSETNGGECTDSFVVTGTSGITTPTICGKNTGQHLYIDVGAASTDNAKLTFTFSGTSTVRTWDIKVTQLPCAASYRAPNGCLQYHVGLTGRFTTFNFLETTTPMHLASQDYSICIRGEEGFCCIAYEKCGDTNSFTIDGNAIAAADLDVNCAAMDYIGIDGVTATCDGGQNDELHTKICGVNFNVVETSVADQTALCDCSAPFIVDIYTDTIADANTNRGICLEYRQVACSNS